MKKGFFLLLLLPLLTACRQDQKTTGAGAASESANAEALGGHWVALDFCSRAAQYGSVLAAMNNVNKPYAYSLSFVPSRPDSVECSNGMETWSLPVVYKKDTMELQGARQGKPVFLVYDSQGEKILTMFDNTETGYMAFLTALNHNLFSGLFIPAGKGDEARILFTPGGFIQGMPEYDRYEVCTAGDCFVAGNDIDVITFSKARTENSSRMFGYRYSGQNDTLRLYNLINDQPDEKGTQTVGSVAYTLIRKKVD
jgi:hypothetical protein